VDGELTNTSAESPSDGKSTLGWEQSTAQISVVGLESVDLSCGDLSSGAIVGDRSGDSLSSRCNHAIGEHNTVVVLGSSSDFDGSSA